VISQIEKAIQSAPSSRPAEVRLRLHPEHLGRVDVLLASGQDGLAVTVTVHNPHTRALIDSLLPQLRTSLEQQGIDVQRLTVAAGNQFAQPDAPDRGWQRESHGSGPAAHSNGWQSRNDATATPPPRRSHSNSLIDYAA
jgi:flagellar hook-length control protein FliK